MRERRRFHRIPQPIEARYRVSGDLGLAWARGNLVNISASGLRFRAEELLEKGALVEIEAKIPGLKELLILKGMIVWSSLQASGVSEMGVEFSEVTVQQQYQIDSLVSFLRSTGTQRAPSTQALMTPDLSVSLGSLRLKNPVLVAAGTFGYGLEFSRAVAISELGAVITKTVTRQPREGNPPPRVVETPSGMLNAIGLQNVGLDFFLKEKLPDLCQMGAPVIVSVLAETEQEWGEMVARVNQTRAAAIELNLSCPNVRHTAAANHGRCVSLVAQDPELVHQMVAAARKSTTKPLIAKLSPDVSDLSPIAQAAERAGADAVTIANTYVGMSWDADTRKSRLGASTGGLSGPAIRALSVYRVWYTAPTIRIPIIGLGGIVRAEDAIEFFLSGAAAIAVGTASFANPKAALNVLRGLKDYFIRHKIPSIAALHKL